MVFLFTYQHSLCTFESVVTYLNSYYFFFDNAGYFRVVFPLLMKFFVLFSYSSVHFVFETITSSHFLHLLKVILFFLGVDSLAIRSQICGQSLTPQHINLVFQVVVQRLMQST